MGPNFLGVGAAEALVVLIIALVVVGPQRFPEIARQGGRWYRIARRYTAEITKDLRAAVDEIEDEVKAEAEGLNEIREIGDAARADLARTETDLEEISRSTAQDASPAPPVETEHTGDSAPRPAAAGGEGAGPSGGAAPDGTSAQPGDDAGNPADGGATRPADEA